MIHSTDRAFGPAGREEGQEQDMNKILAFANRNWLSIAICSVVMVAVSFAWVGLREEKELDAQEARTRALEEKRQKDELAARQAIFKECAALDGVPVLGYGFSIVCLRTNSGCIHFAKMPHPDSFESVRPAD